MLPDAADVRGVVDEIEAAYRAHGSGAAWQRFISLVMHQGPVGADGVPPATRPPSGAGDADADPAQASAEPSHKQRADDELFCLRMLKPFTRYEPAVGC